MRYVCFAIFSCVLFTSCFTTETIEKAKYDRRSEHVDSVLSSYTDSSGNLFILYTKRNKKDIYQSILPADSLIQKYRRQWHLDYANNDSTLAGLKGIFHLSDYTNSDYCRTILFDKEIKLIDTCGLQHAINRDEKIVSTLSEKIRMPMTVFVDSSGEAYPGDYISVKPAGFIYHPADTTSLNSRGIPLSRATDTYIISYTPYKRKYSRYLLVPATLLLDGVTLPFQVIGLIFARLFKDVPIS